MASAESGSETYTALDAELSGHPGHLSAKQQEAFAVFKDRVTQDGAYRPGTAANGETPATLPSHDDVTLLCVHDKSAWGQTRPA